jgi:hypothetical protein
MRKTGWVSSIVLNEHDRTAYLVVDDLEKSGRVWREADIEGTDLEDVIHDLLEGQYKNPIRVIAFNTAEKWSEDVSEALFQWNGVFVFRSDAWPPLIKGPRRHIGRTQ